MRLLKPGVKAIGMNIQHPTEQANRPATGVVTDKGVYANIVTESGQRMFIGDEIDQLRLVAINSDSIEFAGRENISMNW
jgi:type III secretion protein D